MEIMDFLGFRLTKIEWKSNDLELNLSGPTWNKLNFERSQLCDAEEFENRFSAREAQASNPESNRYLSHIDSILQIQDHLLEVSEAHHVPIVDNKSFDKSVLSIIQSLMETLRKREGFDVKSLL